MSVNYGNSTASAPVNYGSSNTNKVDYGKSKTEDDFGAYDYASDIARGVGRGTQDTIHFLSAPGRYLDKKLGFTDENYVSPLANSEETWGKATTGYGEAAEWVTPGGILAKGGQKAAKAGGKWADNAATATDKSSDLLGRIPKTGFGPADKVFEFAMKGKAYTKGSTVKGVFADLKSGAIKMAKGTASLAAGKKTGGLMIGDALFFITKTIPSRVLGGIILKILGKAPSRKNMREATREAKRFQDELARSIPAGKPRIKPKPESKSQGGTVGKGIMRPRYRANKVL